MGQQPCCVRASSRAAGAVALEVLPGAHAFRTAPTPRRGALVTAPANNATRTLGGVLCVFQTPYHADESIDFATLEKEIDWLFDRGADGIVMAMVSEVLRLSSQERHELAERACRVGHPRGVVVISVGAESSHTAASYARHAAKRGRRRRDGRAADRRGPGRRATARLLPPHPAGRRRFR